MDDSFQIRPFKESDTEEIVELLVRSFPGWDELDNPRDYWEWKYRDGLHEPIILVVTDGGKIISVSHDVILTVKVGSESLKANYGDDLATDPAYRGRGAYRLIAEEHIKSILSRGIRYTNSYPISPIVLKSLLREGRKPFPHKLSHQYRVRDVLLHVKATKPRNPTMIVVAYTVLRFISRIRRLLITRKPQDYEVREATAFDDAGPFWEKVKAGHDLIFERTEAYLNWRYCDSRGGRNRVLKATKDGELLGYVVVQFKDGGVYGEAYILDLLCLPGRLDVADSLLTEVCRICDEEAVNVVHLRHVKGHPYGKAAYRNGFLDASRLVGAQLIIQCTDEKFQEIKGAELNRLHIVYGDSF